MLTPFLTEQRARQPYHCNRCSKQIAVGERYVREAWPAWEDCDADVDDYGRSYAVPLPAEDRRWRVTRFHINCLEEW
jgi:hypothetical protein